MQRLVVIGRIDRVHWTKLAVIFHRGTATITPNPLRQGALGILGVDRLEKGFVQTARRGVGSKAAVARGGDKGYCLVEQFLWHR